MDMHAQTDRRLAAAKADLVARIDELQRRFRDVKGKLDISARIVEHPKLAVAAAFALGALLGMGGREGATPSGKVEHGIGGALIAMLGAIGIRLAKETAAHYFSDAAKSWLDDRGPTATERVTSRDPNIESFVDH